MKYIKARCQVESKVEMRVALLVLLLTAVVLSQSCSREPFGHATPFNLYVLGHLDACNSDVEGSIAASGDITLSAYAVGPRLPNIHTHALVNISF